MFRLWLCLGLWVVGSGLAQSWQTASAPGWVVRTASTGDAHYLRQVFAVLQQARKDLQAQGLQLPATVRLVIHPSLDSYTRSTGLPWFVLAVANRQLGQIDTQRLQIVRERSGLEQTLRHELFHLAQPEGWPRWKAEGKAMRFAGEVPRAAPFVNIGVAQLEALLAQPPDAASLRRAVATAYAWSK